MASFYMEEYVSNGIMFQGFEWYLPSDGYFEDMQKKIPDLVEAGVTGIWLPPQCKATGVFDVGYGVYDLYDLGEFDQKGEQRTKYGTKDQYLALINALHEAGIQVYADVVLNHKAGADETESFQAVQVNQANRIEEIGEPHEIDAWTHFHFPGRAGKYSEFQWHWYHFTGVDFDDRSGESGIFRVLGDGKGWAYGVSGEMGNYDYLMFADIDHHHPEVREELFRWAEWYTEETGVDGFRIDAAKHIDHDFMRDFINHVKEVRGEDFYMVGEYWQTDETITDKYLYKTEYDMDLFDVKLHFNMVAAARGGDSYDLRKIFDNTIVQEHPEMAVTFVNNHDSQPGQALENFVDRWFIPHAYALILLREAGYPCVFYGDYYGISGENPIDGNREMLDKLMKIRKAFAYGDQEDHWISGNLIGWVRHGDDQNPDKLLTLINTGDAATVDIPLGADQAGKVFADYLGIQEESVTISDEGIGTFTVGPGNIACWAETGKPID